MIFFRFAKIFQFFVVAPHQRVFEIFKEVEFLHDYEELDIGNGVPLFSVRDPLSVKLTIFKTWPYLK